VVVSGVVDAQRGVERDLLPHAAVRALRLRADASDLRRRLTTRGRAGEDVARELAYAAELDRVHAAAECIDTTGLRVAEVLERLHARIDGWPAAPAVDAGPVAPAADHAPGDILWVCGV